MRFEVRGSRCEVRGSGSSSRFFPRTSDLVPLLLAFAFSIAAHAADRPDLVVVISIDQFRYEYVTRFAPYFAPNGFRRFIDHGADFTHAYYPYSVTFTGPGHAAIGTGYT